MSERDYRTHANSIIMKPSIKPIVRASLGLVSWYSHKQATSYSRNKEKLNARTLSIGNVTLGGSGKTPHAQFLAQHLVSQDRKVGIAISGYGGKARDTGVLVSDGETILAGLTECGDEALALSTSLLGTGIPVLAHRNRIIAAKELIHQFNCDIVILDDAFHFVSVQKDIDCLLVDALNPMGGGLLPERGFMREPLYAAKRADLVIITHANLVKDNELKRLKDLLLGYGFTGPIFESSYIQKTITSVSPGENSVKDATGLNVIPVSGIGNPESFEKSLEEIGMTNPDPIRFNDHHPYTVEDIRLINEAIRKDKADGIITTSKDWIKLKDHVSRIKGKIFILHVLIQIEDDCLKWIDRELLT